MTTMKHRWVGADTAPFVFATSDRTAKSDYERNLGALTIVAHDLRSPLANLALLVDSLTSAAQGGDVHSLQVSKERAHKLIERVDRLLRSVLGRAAVAADPLRVEPIRIDLGDVIDEAVELNRPMAERCSVTLTRGGVDSISAFGDPDLLVEAVDNLVSNAIKHSEIGGQVQCDLVEQGSKAIIRVIDQGCGLTESQIKYIFQPFVRHRSHDRVRDGAGIGLWIARLIAGGHGGHIEATSQGVNLGALFELHLPIPTVGYRRASRLSQ